MNRRVAGRRLGFTLLELLVVVGVIAILIAILVPSLAKAKEAARETVCQTKLRAWGQGFLFYAQDYNGRLPLDGGDGSASTPIGEWDDPHLWFNGVTAYMGTGTKTYDELQTAAKAAGNQFSLPKAGTNSFFVCPSAGDPSNIIPGAAAGNNTTDDVITNGFFMTVGYFGLTSKSPGISETRPMLLCYGMNSKLRNKGYDNWQEYNEPDDQLGENDINALQLCSPPELVPLVAEKRIRPDELPSNDTPNVRSDLTQDKVTATRFSARHNKGGNIAFADGHVGWFNNAQITHGLGANKATNYNIPGVIIWSPIPPPP